MIALAAAVFAASLLGSFHCAGMCGAFVALACGAAETNAAKQRSLQAAYHLGRLATYVTLGAAAGLAGRLVDLTGALSGVQSAAAVLAAFAMLAFAVVALVRSRGASLPKFRLPLGWQSLISKAHRAAMDRPPVARAVAIGLLTTLLPCGWLYAFLVTAAGTGHPLSAALVMAVFWVGTLPVMVVVGAGARLMLGTAGKYLPLVSASAVIVVAALTLIGRIRLDAAALASAVDAAAGARNVQVADPAATPACCQVAAPDAAERQGERAHADSGAARIDTEVRP
ncbi:sulfite exporter TauE/SafE family protein [Humisphaera borealis]|uniref:Sulfite exporter TauE/SafE family protein n=1 Tax=Humisphaera borealis TaxID=2807512 RepID=A0A7M2WSL4_9BACT|nr:sulfite exporter TauE/SafE family protein [Humisphaera borealis]QOV88409.1 sulfite exporter TauE/SafE family protein [Humisphaera borealis]